VTQFKLTDLIVIIFLSLVALYFIISFLVPERVWKDLGRRTRFSRFGRHRYVPTESREQASLPLQEDARNSADPTGRRETSPEEPMTELESAEILGLRGRVTVGEIKAAYRNEMAKYHPDKVTHLGPEFRNMAHNRTRKIRAAYEFFREKYGMD